MSSRYLVALGSNRRHVAYGAPEGVVAAAMEEMASLGTVLARSRIIASAPMGAASRRFANAALVLASELDPPSLLSACKRMEREFGRRRGQRWGDRVLDADIILWSGGVWASSGLTIPHPAFRSRAFVLIPALGIARDWRDPVSGLRLAHLHARLTRPRPLPR
ncbi:MAG: 2-amino-4-hydroxy-6-hydroxymethyldihydropteridine diphosphokinase [Erythrobacter sp.]|jgi:2-amino-4-hydroxy-6-hydroxymethyldihydropteridine diphosphokinase|uniref:2-amino-4-hydroxy-6- hydroxymethyldihydropteridine diphosphokinase n=1 Tax=Erythrobacter sp. TaxID=1042 RepID=UPI002B49F247|nr:2-amino-4-hydroxy-6-hydroxymethyldihydropteridine diphosphokinase [Erythrobacter sp.]WRH69919.1 MAG: 2-amino-4-hydroxy-6-hydroxymethyldihydropteridine diphosphokinase [Erythrobacter sp.]